MSLPNVSVPHYERALPSGTIVKFRPFLVAEEMILLQALESGDENQMRLAVLQVCKDCIIEGPDPSQMPWFDVDALLLLLRGFSVGTGMDVKFTCHHNNCGTEFKTTFDIDDITYHRDKEVDPTIELREGIGVKMKWPTYTSLRNGIYELDDAKQNIELLCDSIESVWDADTVYPANQMTREELKDWVKTLMSKDTRKMSEFVNSAPWIDFTKVADCPKCGFTHELRYEDFRSFFS